MGTDHVEAVGEEILVTYGAHSNDKLLVHYGFVCSYLPKDPHIDDDVRLDHLLLPQLNETVRSQLQDVGFLGGYALLPASNELCFKTQVAVRALLLTCNEWEYFATNGEDLSEDQTAAVAAFVTPLLRDYRSQAEQKLSDLRTLLKQHDVSQRVAISLLQMRWSQIISAIDAFLSS